ncbi:unnamed protein product [Adineta ricciae]|uniref:Uncharacterized protein n=1 Tax=Adineta ricciae TaxID=249248 RepID=A0A814LEF2_ADIRI|nr:unnamed protein product [Adineta ricciae]
MPLSQHKLAVIFGILATVTVTLAILLIPVYMRSRRNNIPSETTLLATTSTSTAEVATDPHLTIFNKITAANEISSLANLLTTKLAATESTSVHVGTTNPLKTRLVSTIEPTTATPKALTTGEMTTYITVNSPHETTPTIEEIYSNNSISTDQTSVVTASNKDLRETTTVIHIEASEISTHSHTSEIPSNESSMMIDTTEHHLNLTNVSEAVSFGTITMTSITKIHETSTDTSDVSSQILRTIPTNTTLNIETPIPATYAAEKTIITTSHRTSLTNKSVDSTETFSLKQRTSILTTAILATRWSTIPTSTTETHLSTANINSTLF